MTERQPIHWPDPREQLAGLGILVCLIGLPLPWYRVSFDSRLTQSGLGGFGFAQAALLLTLAAAGVLVLRVSSGRKLPLPLHAGTLLAVAGAWAAVIIVVLGLDRPTTTIQGLQVDYGLAYGAIISLAGAITLVVAGLRIRAVQLRSEEGARSPSASSPPRSAH